jgi:menaquinone-dependent protoporphyrinogen IX oxidase
MKTLIIYGSQYGSAKRYAERLSELMGIEAVDYKKAKGIEGFDRIIFMGGLYAGGVLGLKKTVGKMADNQELIIVTVGVTDPNETEYFREIRKNIKAKIPANLYNEEKIFHLRGAIEYSRLGLKHRFMMSMFHKMVLKMSESQRTADAKAMLETYGKQVDFVDFSALEQIVFNSQLAI